MKLAAARRELFDESSRPSISSLKRWAASGDLPARKINGVWWVDADVLELTTGDLIADAILMESLDGASA